MQLAKNFAILHQIIQEYSIQPISTSTLLSYLAIQIINDSLVNVEDLPLSKSEVAILKKIGQPSFSKGEKTCFQGFSHEIATQSTLTQNQILSQHKDAQNKQAYKAATSFYFTIFLIHEYQKPAKNELCSKLLKNIQNIIIVDQFLSYSNNILHHETKNALAKPIIIVSINQMKGKRASNVKNGESKGARNQFLIAEMERYMQLWEILYGHVGSRVCMYQEEDSPYLTTLNFEDKIKFFSQTVCNFKDPEDDLDVLLRPQIPNSAFIKIVRQTGYKVSKEEIKSSMEYNIISQGPSYLTFCKSNNSVLKANDQIVIWVTKNNEPYFKLLPQIEKTKYKKRLKITKNDKFEQFRSLLGYTKLLMENKICTVKKERKEQELQSQQLDSSIYFDSQLSDCSILQQKNEDTNSPCICIINIVEKLCMKEEEVIIEQQIKEILDLFFKSRKQVHDNLELNNNLQMIKRVSLILGVSEKDIFHAIYITKL